MYKLREFEKKDISTINKWRNDSDLISRLPYRYINKEVDEKWYENYMNHRNNQVCCAIVDDNDDEILGLISLVSIDHMNQSGKLHIMIGNNEKQNKGLSTFAVKEMVNHAFNNLNLHRIELTVLDINKRAQHLYEEVVFVREETKKQAKYKNVEFVDMHTYALLKRGRVEQLSKILELFTPTLKSLNEGLIDKREYASKLDKYGNTIILIHNKEIISFCTFYCNDYDSKKAFLSMIAVKKDIENRGYGSLLLSECERYCRSQGMKYLQLEVYSDNKNAVAFYKKNKFEIIKSNKEKLLLIKEL